MKCFAFAAIFLFAQFRAAAAGSDAPGPAPTPLERLDLQHLRALHEDRLRFDRERRPLPNLGVYEDFRAVLHAHAEDADHTKGTRAEVLKAAKQTGVRIVMFTDHGGPKPATWRGLRDGVLFFAGEENGGAGLLRFPEFEADGSVRAEGELRFLSHVEERPDAPVEGLAGMEISNRHTDAKLDKALEDYFHAAMMRPEDWRKLVAAFKAYPDEFFAASADYHPEIFAKWDRELAKHHLTGIGANDAHQNQIFLGTTFDPYAVSFRNLCTHILARALTEPEIRQALREGHAYVSHDWLCDPTGFAFGAVNNLGVFPMGDTAVMTGNTRVVGLTPLPAKLKLIHNAKLIKEEDGTNLTFIASEPGAYRLEAWLTVAGGLRPWIYSNPVYLRGPVFSDLRLPSREISPDVAFRKDIEYTAGDPADANKHKLDVYSPKDRPGAPVFFFIHGGAWRSGDRSQYLPLGNRFAKEGIVTIVPSYRLAPKHPHPAQIEDVASAFAWTVQHAAEYGGDPNRIYVGGHSAGGHLAALLALDERYLKAHQLTPAAIRGTIAMSGVFDLAQGDSQASVFGRNRQNRREASPLFHVRHLAPPFLISYCQWDYPTLPAQARAFHAALQKAGVPSELKFVPRESHISEMISLTRDDDPMASAILHFIQPDQLSR